MHQVRLVPFVISRENKLLEFLYIEIKLIILKL